jgi:hypothetical protein
VTHHHRRYRESISQAKQQGKLFYPPVSQVHLFLPYICEWLIISQLHTANIEKVSQAKPSQAMRKMILSTCFTSTFILTFYMWVTHHLSTLYSKHREGTQSQAKQWGKLFYPPISPVHSFLPYACELLIISQLHTANIEKVSQAKPSNEENDSIHIFLQHIHSYLTFGSDSSSLSFICTANKEKASKSKPSYKENDSIHLFSQYIHSYFIFVSDSSSISFIQQT